MSRLIGRLVIFAVILAAVAYWRGWINWSSSSSDGSSTIKIETHNDKMASDVSNAIESIKKKIEELKKKKSADPSADVKAKIDEEIKELERQRDEKAKSER